MSDDKPTCFGSKPGYQAQAENDCYHCSWLYECHGDNDILDDDYVELKPWQIEMYKTLTKKKDNESFKKFWKTWWRKK